MRFAVIGAQKSASTSLQKAIAEHPAVYMPRGETPVFEHGFYSPDAVQSTIAAAQRAAGKRVMGIKRPDYLAQPEVPGNLALHFPDARLIAVLRDPADRAITAYYHYVRYGFIPYSSHEDGLRRLMDEPASGRAAEILRYGMYGAAIERWHARFTQEQLLLIRQDDLLSRPEETLGAVFRHVGISPAPDICLGHAMESMYHPLRLKLRALSVPLVFRTHENGRLQERARPISIAWEAVDRGILAPLLRAPRPKASVELRALLREYYRSDQELLYSRTGIRFTSGSDPLL